MAKRAVPLAPESEVVQAILAAVEQSQEPIAAAKLKAGLKGPLRRPEDRVIELLEVERTAGRVFRFAPSRGKSPCYARFDHATYARRVIEAAVRKKPMPLKDLEKTVAGKLKDLTPAARKEILDDLVAQRTLFLVPGPSERSAFRYSAAPPDPRDYLRTVVKQWRGKLEKIARQLEPCGVPGAAVLAAALEMLRGDREAPPPSAARAASVVGEGLEPRDASPDADSKPPADLFDFAAQFDRAFQQLDRQKGSHNFVSLVDLRRALAAFNREEFDRGLRDLRLSGRYELSSAESLGGLRPEEREAGIAEAGALLLYASRKVR